MTLPHAISTTTTNRRVVIAAGGTGGHFFPAEALAATLLARGHDIALLTDSRSGGADSRVFADHPVHVLKGAGIAGRGAARAAQAGFALSLGSLQARSLLRGLHPSVIVGFGGYPSIAPIIGSRMLRRRVPIVLHEQNAVLGRTNKAMARQSAALALSFLHTARIPPGVATTLTGNPVRPGFVALASSPYSPPGDGRIQLLILGGSLGARVLSEVVPPALAALPADLRARLIVHQQCRDEDLPAARATYHAAGIDAVLDNFFTDVPQRMAGCHLAIARAGASTVAELAVIGRPAIFVPLPGAIDDHQTENAAALGDSAWRIEQSAFTAPALTALLTKLLADPATLITAAAKMAAQGRPRACDALADLVEGAIKAARA